MSNIQTKERFLRLTDVIKRTGLSRSSIYQNIADGNFPTNISLGARSVAWLESEIDAWMQTRINQRSASLNMEIAK